MSLNKFFVEGKADSKFLQDYLRHLLGIEFQETDFYIIGGNSDALIGAKKNEFLSNSDLGGRNLIILDADSDRQATTNRINALRSSINVQFELFVLPNDHENGELENLLLGIVHHRNMSILTCFDEYQNCLIRINRGYKVPSLKAKVYAYLDAMAHGRENEKMVKEESRNYLIENHWNLDHSSLKPLKTFLEQYVIR